MWHKKYTQEEAIAKSISVQGDKFYYHKAIYKGNAIPFNLICKKRNHDIWQTPHQHFSGDGCQLCAYIDNGFNRRKKALPLQEAKEYLKTFNFKNCVEYKKWFIDNKGNSFHFEPNKMYSDWISWDDYLGTNNKRFYKNEYLPFDKARSYIQSLKFKNQNEFFKWVKSDERPINIPATPQPIYKNCGWKNLPEFLGYEGKTIKSTNEEFIKKSFEIFGDLYDYSLVIYEGNKIKVIIKCNRCKNNFSIRPNDHLSGVGCPDCNKNNVSEERLTNFIKENFENVIPQYRPKWLYGKTSPLSLDIYLADYNIAIEYQGAQHFIAKKFFGGEEGLVITQDRDRRKLLKCEENFCKLFYFNYTLDEIPFRYHQKIYSDEYELLKAIKDTLHFRFK